MTFPFAFIDISILIILLFFILGGARKGFVRSLCSLLAVFVALFGAILLSKYLAPHITELAAPHAVPSIVMKMEAGSSEGRGAQSPTPQDTSTLLKNLSFPEYLSRIVEDLYTSSTPEEKPFHTPSQMLAFFLLKTLIPLLVFFISFFLLLILWGVLSRGLNLVTKLPVLNFCNKSLGAVLGAVKGLIFLFLLAWILSDLTSTIPLEALEHSLFFQWFSALPSMIPLSDLLFDFHQNYAWPT